MLPQAYYYLADAESILAVSRHTIGRLEAVGLLLTTGKNRGKRVQGASLRALVARIEEGGDLWQILHAAESARSEPKLTAKARSTKTNKADGGSSRHQRTESALNEFEPLQSKKPEWLKEIILPGESRA
jgi:hypothetical protein